MYLVIRGGAIKLIGKSCLIHQIILLKVRNLVRFKTMLLQSKKKWRRDGQICVYRRVNGHHLILEVEYHRTVLPCY